MARWKSTGACPSVPSAAVASISDLILPPLCLTCSRSCPSSSSFARRGAPPEHERDDGLSPDHEPDCGVVWSVQEGLAPFGRVCLVGGGVDDAGQQGRRTKLASTRLWRRRWRAKRISVSGRRPRPQLRRDGTCWTGHGVAALSPGLPHVHLHQVSAP